MELSALQLKAIQDVLDSKSDIVKLNGAAGTGKTTCMQHLHEALLSSYMKSGLPSTVMVQLDKGGVVQVGKGMSTVVAPTNKAAHMLRTKGLPYAGTLYSIFFTLVDKSGRPISPAEHRKGDPLLFKPNNVLVREGYQLGEGKLAFSHFIICDEASMVHSQKVDELASMCDQLILVGDDHQLPPVNDTRCRLGVFNTMQPTAQLTEVFRQAEGSDILECATAIRTFNGHQAYLQCLAQVSMKGMLQVATPELYAVPNRQFIVHSNAARVDVNRYVRRMLGRNSDAPEVGEPLVCKGNYADGFYNGTPCVVVAATPVLSRGGLEVMWLYTLENELGEIYHSICEPKEFYRTKELIYSPETPQSAVAAAELLRQDKSNVWLDLLDFIAQYPQYAMRVSMARLMLEANEFKPEDFFDRFQFGYAMTVHSAQGSEWDNVALLEAHLKIPKIMGSRGKDQPFNAAEGVEAARRWIYTAVTRAKNSLLVCQGYRVEIYALEEEFM